MIDEGETSTLGSGAGRTAKGAASGLKASAAFNIAGYLQSNEMRARYLEGLIEDGDMRVLTVGLRELAASIGGMAELACKTGLSRESLYRTLSARGNPRLDTLAAILAAFDLRLTVKAAA